MSEKKTIHKIDGKRVSDDLDALACFGETDEGGVTRLSFSSAFNDACEWLIKAMRDAGLDPHRDAAGNIIGRAGPDKGAAVIVGSHIDSVPNGGRFDGTLGVVAGLEVARTFRDNGVQLQRPFEVIAFADEEGTYISQFGSRAMTGELTYEEALGGRGAGGETLREALSRSGMTPENIRSAYRDSAEFHCYLELHIEQGPVLEAAGLDIGVVDAIVCADHADVWFAGESGHAGTTPMDGRNDAFRAAARYADEAFNTVYEYADTRLTFGIVELSPQASNVIPGRVRLRQDLRCPDDSMLDTIRKRLENALSDVSIRENVECEIIDVSRNPSAEMDRSIRNIVQETCVNRGLGWQSMVSGATHDAQTMARRCAASLVFVPSEKGRSHRPDEFTSAEALNRGVQVIADSVYRLCLV